MVNNQLEPLAQYDEQRVLKAIELDLFPNPTTDGITVTLSQPVDQVAYDVYDAQGRSVLHGKMHGGRLDISTTAIPSGYYNFCLVRGQEMLVRSFVVEHCPPMSHLLVLERLKMHGSTPLLA